MNIFLTGASGFVGSNLMSVLLKEGHKLLLLALDENDYQLLTNYNAQIITGDITNIESFRKDVISFNPQVCVHLAWEAIPNYSFEISKKNLDNSIRLTNLIINETSCKKILVSGSCYEYGKTMGECKETDNTYINSFFSWAKYSLYAYCNYVCKESNVDLVWFRIFYVYGPRQRKFSLIPMLVDSFLNGESPEINNPFNANDFIYIGDVVEAFKIAISQKVESGIYNLGTGKSSRVIDICEIVENIIHKNSDISKKICLNCNSHQTVNFWADINKTHKNLLWVPTISVRDGIEKYLEYLEIE